MKRLQLAGLVIVLVLLVAMPAQADSLGDGLGKCGKDVLNSCAGRLTVTCEWYKAALPSGSAACDGVFDESKSFGSDFNSCLSVMEFLRTQCRNGNASYFTGN